MNVCENELPTEPVFTADCSVYKRTEGWKEADYSQVDQELPVES